MTCVKAKTYHDRIHLNLEDFGHLWSPCNNDSDGNGEEYGKYQHCDIGNLFLAKDGDPGVSLGLDVRTLKGTNISKPVSCHLPSFGIDESLQMIQDCLALLQT